MANEEHVALLKRGVDTWNEWRRKNAEVRPDLSEGNLKETDLGGARLVEADLRGANLSKAILRTARLGGLDLSDTDLSGADFRRAIASNADLSGANLSYANLMGADLSGADLSKADVSEADLRGMNLSGAKLRGANLNKVDLSWAHLQRADLSGVDLSGANLTRTKLSGADLSKANLSGRDLSEANLSEVNLRKADLTGADLSKTNLSNGDLSGADLSGGYLTEANFSDANLRGANLSEAHLNNVVLRGTILTTADLSRTVLSGQNLSGSDLSGTNLHRVDLRGAILIDTILDDAILTAAKLWTAQRDGWSIKGVICEYAFWDREGKEPTHYGPGEFERLHADGVKIELHYAGGIGRMEVLTLPMLLQHLEGQHEGCVLRLKSIEDAPGGAKAIIVVDATGGEEPTKLSAELNVQAQEAQIVQRRLIEEQCLRLKFEAQVEVLSDLVRGAMSEKKQISVGNIGTVGTIGDITDNAQLTIDQSIHYNQNDLTKIANLISDIRNRYPELTSDLPFDRLAKLEAIVQSIQSQLAQPTPDKSLIKQSLGTLKSILERATGNVLAGGWLKVLEGLV